MVLPAMDIRSFMNGVRRLRSKNWQGRKESVKIIPKDRVGTIIPKGEDEGLEVQIELPSMWKPPLKKNRKLEMQ